MKEHDKIIEDSKTEVESAIKNGIDEIGPGEIPEEVKEEEKEDK